MVVTLAFINFLLHVFKLQSLIRCTMFRWRRKSIQYKKKIYILQILHSLLFGWWHGAPPQWIQVRSKNHSYQSQALSNWRNHIPHKLCLNPELVALKILKTIGSFQEKSVNDTYVHITHKCIYKCICPTGSLI